MTVKYAPAIAESRHVFASDAARAHGMTRDGYTTRRGCPTDVMVRLVGEKRWYRVYAWQWSNMPTTFIRIKGEPHVVSAHDVPKPHA